MIICGTPGGITTSYSSAFLSMANSLLSARDSPGQDAAPSTTVRRAGTSACRASSCTGPSGPRPAPARRRRRPGGRSHRRGRVPMASSPCEDIGGLPARDGSPAREADRGVRGPGIRSAPPHRSCRRAISAQTRSTTSVSVGMPCSLCISPPISFRIAGTADPFSPSVAADQGDPRGRGHVGADRHPAEPCPLRGHDPDVDMLVAPLHVLVDLPLFVRRVRLPRVDRSLKRSRAVPRFFSTRPVPRTIASGIAPASPQKFPIVFANGFSSSGLTSPVIRPSRVVPKSTRDTGVPEVDRGPLRPLLDPGHREFTFQ